MCYRELGEPWRSVDVRCNEMVETFRSVYEPNQPFARCDMCLLLVNDDMHYSDETASVIDK